jgi:hypothetical protein
VDYGDADTPLARWLRSMIGDIKLKEIERRSRKRGVPITASLLSNYLHAQSVPKPLTQRRLSVFFSTPLSEVADLDAAVPLAVIASMRAHLDSLEAQVASGRITNADLVKMLERINPAP